MSCIRYGFTPKYRKSHVDFSKKPVVPTALLNCKDSKRFLRCKKCNGLSLKFTFKWAIIRLVRSIRSSKRFQRQKWILIIGRSSVQDHAEFVRKLKSHVGGTSIRIIFKSSVSAVLWTNRLANHNTTVCDVGTRKQEVITLRCMTTTCLSFERCGDHRVLLRLLAQGTAETAFNNLCIPLQQIHPKCGYRHRTD